MVRRRQGGGSASATARASFSVGLHRWCGRRVGVVLPITSIRSTSTLPISTLPITSMTSSLPSLERRSFLFGGGGNQGTVQLMDLDIDLKISKIEKNVSIDHTRHCIQTSNKNLKIYPRINSTFKVIRKCIFLMLSVLEVAQRVPPTCIIKISRTKSTAAAKKAVKHLVSSVSVDKTCERRLMSWVKFCVWHNKA